ncbi:uncharacterized protein Eint_091860 [Encephalitozoon intestinalis ATCC 50506]|uniref:SEP domain-containing protein n=1 Tax=Encephalitozoon intestinalis (strain ATCC 50506) TaxID=876142 RepID=E0S970_ENCIT|nr:uncharacterized protein Eint_091860 [Encephalitozoon intestinalis ATCC 50506]ADM12313.2 hypothetical protein Eint_091860 [Encephalitozoon intestinalis ATCC 50506]UTX46125.1 hypothetical protein GPK93_09g17140 [Encephalitozoon intestinalis]
MNSEARIKKIMEETGCSLEVAKKAEQESQGNLNAAIEMAKKKGNVLYSGGNSGLYVEENPSRKSITQYKNGILVEDKFYDFSVDNNIRLKDMLEKGTFDASLLVLEGDTAEVIYSERLDEEYKEKKPQEPSKVTASFVGEGRQIGNSSRDIPCNNIEDTLEIVHDGDTVFKVMIGSKRVTVKMHKFQTVGDFFDYMERYYDFGLVLSTNGKEIPPSHSVEEISNKLVLLSRR